MSQENPDGLVDQLRLGCVYRPKRWSGDTHTDLGGSVDEEATDALMADAADLIDALLSDDVLTDPVMPRGKIIGRLVFDRSTPENTAEPVAAAVHTRPEHTTAGHWMPMPENTAELGEVIPPVVGEVIRPRPRVRLPENTAELS